MMSSKMVNPVLMWAVIIAPAALFFLQFPMKELLPVNMLSMLILIFSLSYWTIFFIGAILVNRSAGVSVSAVRDLATTGVYSLVRHPIYSADIVLSWGAFAVFPQLPMLFSVLWLNVVMLVWMRLEEKFLLEKFGNAYEEYRRKVPMAIPKANFHFRP